MGLVREPPNGGTRPVVVAPGYDGTDSLRRARVGHRGDCYGASSAPV